MTKPSPLDPQDWEATRKEAHDLLGSALDWLRDVRDRPVWTPVPEAVQEDLSSPMPQEAREPGEVCRDALRLVLPYATGNVHPRFFGWVHGTGTVGGVLSAMLTATMNSNAGGRDHGAVYLERQVITWFRDLFGLPPETSGILLSGTSMATLLGLAVARNSREENLRETGLWKAKPMLVYTSSESHVSVAKALELLGMGKAALRTVPVDGLYRINTNVLRAMITRDLAQGLRPACVVATAGTVNTGAFDDLEAVADLCGEFGLWMHVDGAFGALVRLAPELAPLVSGIERADSLAFDLHKWLHVPYDAGCLLVRDGEAHRRTFASHADYLAPATQGLAGGRPWFCEFGPELSRENRALKVWFTLQEHGARRLGEGILENCAQARDLAQRVEAEPELERAAPVSLNIVCFRFRAPDLDPTAQDRLQEAIATDLQLSGLAVLSTTRLQGRVALRAAITNHRTKTSDLPLLIDGVLNAGRRLHGGGPMIPI